MKILAVETSCDETALALVEAAGPLAAPKFRVLKNLVSSQIPVHAPFGGVVPSLAKREHVKNLPVLLDKITAGFSKSKTKSQKSHVLKNAGFPNSIDAVVVTVGPGLEPALWTGVNFAQEFARKYRKPLVGANHLEGHLYSFLLAQKDDRRYATRGTLFPAVALIASGGHTVLLKMDSLTKWKRLGETRDAAAGEAFDKVARLLSLPYPGGPALEKLARAGNPRAVKFPRPMLHQKNYDFSFSGLKTSVLYYLRENPRARKEDVAASFQAAVVDVLVAKAIRAAKEFKAKSVMLSGGVAANKPLRAALRREAKKIAARFFVPASRFNTDNAAMIAAAGYMAYLRRKKYPMRANGNLSI